MTTRERFPDLTKYPDNPDDPDPMLDHSPRELTPADKKRLRLAFDSLFSSSDPVVQEVANKLYDDLAPVLDSDPGTKTEVHINNILNKLEHLLATAQ